MLPIQWQHNERGPWCVPSLGVAARATDGAGTGSVEKEVTQITENAIIFDSVGGIAQLGERLHGMQEVSGSIPLTSTRIPEIGSRL